MAFKTANPDATRRHIRIIISQVAIRVKDGWSDELRPPVLARPVLITCYLANIQSFVLG